MTRQIVISGEAHAALCEIAARMRQPAGRAVSFPDVAESLAGVWDAA